MYIDRGSNPGLSAHKTDALPTVLPMSYYYSGIENLTFVLTNEK
jgi:hypothetical protein